MSNPPTPPPIKISDSEWLVMQVLWAKSPQLAQEIIEQLTPSTGWNHRTVKTLLARLVRKGALRYDKADRSYLYHAAIDQKTCVHAETRSFLDRFHGGTIKPLLAAFIENEKLSAEDIEELKAILEKRKEQ